jgi:hypothetical protein
LIFELFLEMTDFTPSQLNRMDTARLATYRTNLDFYQGSQWQTMSRHRQLVFNYAKVSIDKVTSFLMPGLGFACYPNSTNPTNPTNSHPILSGEYREESHASRARAIGQDGDANRIVQNAFDWDLLKLGIDVLEQVYDPNLNDSIRAQERADALLRTQQTQSTPATIVVPTNVGQELLDVVEVTDKRCGISEEKYRVEAIQTDYDRRQGIYTQRLALCAP